MTQIIKERVENPVETKDLLNLMLNGTDPVTGESEASSEQWWYLN